MSIGFDIVFSIYMISCMTKDVEVIKMELFITHEIHDFEIQSFCLKIVNIFIDIYIDISQIYLYLKLYFYFI